MDDTGTLNIVVITLLFGVLIGCVIYVCFHPVDKGLAEAYSVFQDAESVKTEQVAQYVSTEQVTQYVRFAAVKTTRVIYNAVYRLYDDNNELFVKIWSDKADDILYMPKNPSYHITENGKVYLGNFNIGYPDTVEILTREEVENLVENISDSTLLNNIIPN